jgi:predicted HicB family RNase H-like nuclease
VGRPSKGTRLRLNLRVPLTLYRQIAAAALAADQPLNDYCIAVLAAHTRSLP